MNKRLFADFSLLSVAFVWGTTFVIVQKAINTLPPHTFNGIRFAFASLFLFIFILLKNKSSFKKINRKILKSGIILGIFLFGGYAFQTVGLLYTTASKAGFITGLSVVLVPIFSIALLKIFPKWPTIVGVLLATSGLYLLTMTGDNIFQFGDFLIFFCAIFFALQIVFTSRFAPNFDVFLLAWIQISVVGILSLSFGFLFEGLSLSSYNLINFEVIIALIITSIFATAFAFLIQTSLQRYTTPTRVAIIFAMEPVFAAMTSFVLLDERLGTAAITGGLLIFLGMILAELKPETIYSLLRIKPKTQGTQK